MFSRRLYEVSETVTGLQLIMEYAPGGELFARLTEDGPYEEDRAKSIFAQVASGVDYMHNNLFIHRDLKAENVFFAAGRDMVKVGDFGFATQVNRVDQHLNTFCGSPPYAAPELFQVKLDKKILLLILILGNPPSVQNQIFQ